MFYYAEINSEYQVINKHCLSTESTNPNYILIAEDLYTNGNELGDIVGQFYNTLTGIIEIVDPGWDMGQTCWMRYKDSQMRLSTKLDNMDKATSLKADANHTHEGYANSDDLQALEDTVATKANTVHSHTEYAASAHEHDEYAEVGHNHNTLYSPISHSHTEYATTVNLDALETEVDGKANTSHSHNDIYYTETEINDKLATKADSSHNHTGVYDVSGAAANALSSAQTYTDEAIDTLNEIVAIKASTSDLTSHTGNSIVHITSTERNDWNAAKTHANSAHAPVNAEENQNAFSNIAVGSTTISADSKSDTLTLVAGNNVTITPDATGDSITISSANTVYTHPTSAGNKHIPAGGSSGQILRWSADGTAVWGNDNNTTYSNATQTTSGLMSDIDKTKLDGIAVGANNYVLPSAGSSLGGVKTGGDVTISSGVITVNDDSHNHIISNVDGLQSALDSKAASGHDHNSTYYTETEVDTLLSGKANSSHTHTIANITNLQSTLDGKAASSHTHNYAGSSSAGGVATSANKLATARTISLAGDVTGSTSFDGSGNVSITATVADDSHNHTIANVDGLQSALDGKSATSHNHNSAYISKDLQMTADNGDISISWSGKDVVAQFKALASGMYTAYSPIGNTNNPNSGEAFRFMCHKTGSVNYGWIMAYGGKGSVYTGYIDNGNWQGWKALWEYAPAPLWSGGANGGYYMTATHTITPTKKLSECRNGWALLWSDYDVGDQANNTDFYVSYIYKRAYTGQVWGGGEWYCDIPSYSAGTATDSEQRVIKVLQIYDAKIVGTANNAAAPRNDVVLRAVYEF